MLGDISGAEHIYVACGYTDMRKSIDGLAAFVKQSFQLDPFSNSLFLFCGHRRDRMKALYWEGDGFVLLYKRLEIRRELKLIPAQAVIVEHIDYVYSCRDCETNACSVPIIKAPIEQPVIKGSFASPEAVAHIMTQKFVNGMPLYRQEQEFNRMGIGLSRQTMSNWLVKCAED